MNAFKKCYLKFEKSLGRRANQSSPAQIAVYRGLGISLIEFDIEALPHLAQAQPGLVQLETFGPISEGSSMQLDSRGLLKHILEIFYRN